MRTKEMKQKKLLIVQQILYISIIVIHRDRMENNSIDVGI